jgi:DEAD/DEAH box helicase domain-containing protein
LGLISRDRSIAPQDIDSTSTNIALISEVGPRRLTDAVVIYDSVYGGLRLTEELFTGFARYIGQLGRAANLAGDEAIVSDETTERLRTWAETLTDSDTAQIAAVQMPDGFAGSPPPQAWLPQPA